MELRLYFEDYENAVKDDDGDSLGFLPLLEPAQDFKSIDVGENEVEKNQRGLLPAGDLHGVLAAPRLDDEKAFGFQDMSHLLEVIKLKEMQNQKFNLCLKM